MTIAMPNEVISFWREAGKDRWWKKNDDFDRDVTSRFMATWLSASRGDLAFWESSDEGLLALIIVLDQFPRNMFRGDPRSFVTDAQALAVAERAVERGTDLRVENDFQQFVYMPFMHSEQLAHQHRCVELFRAAENTFNLKFAEEHADIIRRFGRFPHRNKILDRDTTTEEQVFLDSGGFSG